MKSLIIFDSQFGNTQKIAKAIADGLGTKAVSVADVEMADLSDLDLVVVGSPINGWRPSVKMLEFLAKLKSDSLKGVKAAAFDTRIKLFIHGDAASKIAKSLEKAGATIISTPKPFYVKGTEGPLFENEIKNAQKWTESIKSQFE